MIDLRAPLMQCASPGQDCPAPASAASTMNRIPDAIGAAVMAARERLAAQFGPRLRSVRVFGSHATGQAHDGSDVDVLVVLDVVASVADRHLAMVAVIDVGLERDLLLEPHVVSESELALQMRCGTALAGAWAAAVVV